MKRVTLTVVILFSTLVSDIDAQPMGSGLLNLLKTSMPDKTLVPVENLNDTVKLTLDLLMERVQLLDDRNEELHWSGFVSAKWRNPFLTWRPEDHGGVEMVFVSEHDVWTPDLSIFERLDTEIGFKDQKRRLLTLRHTGDMQWTLGGDLLVTRCKLNVYRFPFDSQECFVNVGSFVLTSEYLDLVDGGGSRYNGQGNENTLWVVTGWRSRIDTYNYTIIGGPRSDDFQMLYFSIRLERKYGYYLYSIVIPCVLMAALMGSVFWVPPDSGEKISFAITLLLALNVIQLVASENMPKTSDSVPIISVYVTAVLFLSAFAVILAILVLAVHRHGLSLFPRCIAAVLKLLARATCRARKRREMYGIENESYSKRSSVQLETKSESNGNAHHTPPPREITKEEKDISDNCEVALALDTVFFRLFMVLVLGFTVGCALALALIDDTPANGPGSFVIK